MESSSNPDDPANEEYTQLKLAISQQAQEREVAMEDVTMNSINMEHSKNLDQYHSYLFNWIFVF